MSGKSQQYDNLNIYHTGFQYLTKPWQGRAETHLELIPGCHVGSLPEKHSVRSVFLL